MGGDRLSTPKGRCLLDSGWAVSSVATLAGKGAGKEGGAVRIWHDSTCLARSYGARRVMPFDISPKQNAAPRSYGFPTGGVRHPRHPLIAVCWISFLGLGTRQRPLIAPCQGHDMVSRAIRNRQRAAGAMPSKHRPAVPRPWLLGSAMSRAGERSGPV